MNKYLLPVAVLVVLIGAVAVYANKKSSDDAMMMKKDGSTPTATATPDEAMMMKAKEQESMAMKKDAGAAVIDYKSESDAQALVSEHGKDVVYFFAASWCPDCQAINKKLDNADDLAKLGSNTVIVRVNYDTEKSLKSKYNITHQTAFVRIDASGKAVKQEVLSTYDDILRF
jgi:thiol-disulfide isomerase/thioredoxin